VGQVQHGFGWHFSTHCWLLGPSKPRTAVSQSQISICGLGVQLKQSNFGSPDVPPKVQTVAKTLSSDNPVLLSPDDNTQTDLFAECQ